MIHDETAPSDRLIARFPRPAAERETRLAIIGDPHVSTRGEGGHRLPEHSEEYLRRAIADANERAVDGAASVGDLSANGGPWDFDAVDRLLEELDAPFVSIPGNHDVPATSGAGHEVLPQAEFESRYSGGSVPLSERFGDVELVGLDSMRLRRTLAEERESDQLRWLDDALRRLDDPIVMVHHPLPGMSDWLREYEDRIEGMTVPTLWENPEPLLDVLEARDVSLVLSGHKHTPGVAATGGVWEVMAPSTTLFPQGYLQLDVGPEGTDVTFVPLADREELQEAFLRRYNKHVKSRTHASAGAVFLTGAPVDVR